jgi:hypothetical protein
VQRYCGLEKRQVTLALSVGGLDGSLPQIFSCLKNLGIPSAFSDFTLVFFSLWSAVTNAHKTVYPGHEAQLALLEGKELELQNQVLCEQKE